MFVATPALAQSPTGEPSDEPSDEQRTEARELYTQGVQLAAQERWQDALLNFERALALVEHPNVIRAVAGAMQRLGRFREAYAMHERWLELAPADDPERAEIERLLELDRSRVAHLNLTVSPPDARVSIDGGAREEGAGEALRELPLDPGAHRVAIRADGHESERLQITVASGETVAREVELVAIVPVPTGIVTEPHAPAPDLSVPDLSVPVEKRDDEISWVLMGAGAAVLAAGAVMLGIGANAWVTVTDADGRDWTDVEGAHDSAGPLLVAGGIAAGVGLAAFGVGLAIALNGPLESVTLRVGPGGLALSGRLP